MITVTSLTFSLTLVTLQLASGQFSPRLLRTFARDRFVQRTLALFVATFVYALTVLRAVRSGRADQPDFVPRVSVSLAYLLALVSAVSLVVFLGHLVRQIRVETILETVQAESIKVADAMFNEFGDAEADKPAPTHRLTRSPSPPSERVFCLAWMSGYLSAQSPASTGWSRWTGCPANGWWPGPQSPSLGRPRAGSSTPSSCFHPPITGGSGPYR